MARRGAASLVHRRGASRHGFGAPLGRAARAFATRHGRGLAGMALVRTGRIYVHAGKNQQAVSALRTALGEFTRTGDPHGRFLAILVVDGL